MDELELLKKDWQNKDKNLPRLSYDQIHRMIWKRSSSIVKWIFYISILEFVFWTAISISLKGVDLMADFDEINHLIIIQVLTYLGYAGLITFIYLFFLNYKRISVIDNAKQLLKNILRTRKTVNYYVWFNLIYFAVLCLVIMTIQANNNNEFVNLHHQYTQRNNETTFYFLIYGVTLMFILIVGFMIWLFYRLIYGILLGKLKRNYNELKSIDL